MRAPHAPRKDGQPGALATNPTPRTKGLSTSVAPPCAPRSTRCAAPTAASTGAGPWFAVLLRGAPGSPLRPGPGKSAAWLTQGPRGRRPKRLRTRAGLDTGLWTLDAGRRVGRMSHAGLVLMLRLEWPKAFAGNQLHAGSLRVRSGIIRVSIIRDEGQSGLKLRQGKDLTDWACQSLSSPLHALRRGFADPV